MGKTKIMFSGKNLNFLKDPEQHLYYVSQKGVENNSKFWNGSRIRFIRNVAALEVS